MNNFVHEQLDYFNNLISQIDICKPSPEVTRLFNELLMFCCTTPMCSFVFERILETDSVLKTICDNLQRLRSQYEYHLEMNLAKMYVCNKNQNSIEHFSNDGDYHQLIQLEMNMLRNVGIHFSQKSMPNNKYNHLVTKVAFIGSGPMPISSMLILSEYAPFIDIYNIDMSYEANQLASTISERYLPSHLSKRMHFITQDISRKPIPLEIESILKECQLIFLAALVGHDEETKLDILQNIVKHSKNEVDQNMIQHIIIRTTDGLRQVLYPKISAETIEALQVFRSDDSNNTKKKKSSLEIRSISPHQEDVAISIIIARIIK